MKMLVRILLILLCAALIIALPFTVSSPNMLNDVKLELMNEGNDEDEIDFGKIFFSSAIAEDLEITEIEEGTFASHPEWTLPLDFTPGQEPNALLYSEDGYEDESIRVKMEHQEMDDGTKMHIAYIQIADASQLRTMVAHPEKLANTQPKLVTKMTREANAVIAISGDNYNTETKKKTFEYRMTKKISSKKNDIKDILIIDDLGDFHLFIHSKGLKEYSEEVKKEGRTIVNGFTFGPALVKDGEHLTMDKDYGYNPGGREPRAAIGQMGPLSYVLVLIEAQSRDGKSGFSQQKLADFMYDLGCQQAFNLDGGNSAIMVFGDQIYKGQPGGDERQLFDIIYFASSQR